MWIWGFLRIVLILMREWIYGINPMGFREVLCTFLGHIEFVL